MHELQPDAGAQLADGVVVETRLVARLLGMRVLRVDGTVCLSPARVVDRSPVLVVPPADTPDLPLGGELAQAAEVLRALGARESR